MVVRGSAVWSHNSDGRREAPYGAQYAGGSVPAPGVFGPLEVLYVEIET